MDARRWECRGCGLTMEPKYDRPEGADLDYMAWLRLLSFVELLELEHAIEPETAHRMREDLYRLKPKEVEVPDA